MAGNKIAKATGILVIINFGAKILGLARETIIARYFGATLITDAYLVAYTIPFLIYQVIGGALSTAVLPVLTELRKEKGEQQALKLVANLVNLLTLFFCLLTAVGIVFAPFFTKLIAPGLTPEALALASALTRIMFPLALFSVIGMVFTGLLNSLEIFAITAIAPALSNLVMILSMVIGSRFGIYGLAVGTLLGWITSALVQIPSVKKVKFRFKPTLNWRDPDFRRVISLALPTSLGIGILQIYVAMDRVFASGLAEGSIAALNYANKLMQLVLGIFVTAVAMAIYPALAQKAVTGEREELANILNKGLLNTALVSMPAAVGLIAIGEPIVRLLFERGAFDARATAMTTIALTFFSFGLLAHSTNQILTKVYYAFQDTITPVVISFIAVMINIALSFMLRKPMAHAGLALANSIAATFNMLILGWYVRRVLPSWNPLPLLSRLAKIVLSSLILGGVAFKLAQLTADYSHLQGSLLALVQVGAAVLGGCLSYILALIILRVPEAFEALVVVRKLGYRLTKKLV